MQIVTYHSDEVTSENLRWISYIMNGGIFIPVRFNGNTKKDAITKAKFWLEQQQPKVPEYQKDTTPEAYEDWKNSPDEQKVSAPKFNRGSEPSHGMIGKAWVLNRETGHRARVPAEELQGYLDRGYIRGGPRTK